MLLDLDDPRSTDPALTGAKAAWLAKGRQAGLPVLPGLVVPAPASMPTMRLGVEVMAERGSGGARLAMSQEPLDWNLAVALAEAVPTLGEPVVVRSSSVLEGGGEWSGAFTSYIEVRPNELETAIRGCWASAFTVHALDRYAAADLPPGSVPIGVLIQPTLFPDFGGTARLQGDDAIVVAVAGSPAPLVQGWEPGVHAKVDQAGAVSGPAAIELMGADLVATVASEMRRAHDSIGATACEWAAVAGVVHMLQLVQAPEVHTDPHHLPAGLTGEIALALARLVRRAPGPMGEALVLPWAVGRPDVLFDQVDPADTEPLEALRRATELARALTAEVWGMAKPMAVATAQETLRELRSSDPRPALGRVDGLRPPDPERARMVRALLAQVHRALAAAGAVSRPEMGWHVDPAAAGDILRAGRAPDVRSRIGFDRWEPFDAAVVMGTGRTATGVAAAPGIAAGRLCWIPDPSEVGDFRPRDVVVSVYPVPGLAALLWDAAALVTTGGGPAAHLFESARALVIPAVCGVRLDEALGTTIEQAHGRFAVAADGTDGVVAVGAW
jgi:hypothetical protein